MRLVIGRYLGALALAAVIAWPLLWYPPGSDQATFSYIARLWLDGNLPFRDALDTKPPGIYLVYMLAELLFGRNLYNYRLLEIFTAALAVFPLRALFQAIGRSPSGGTLAYVLYLALYFMGNDFWNLSQTEFYLGIASLFYLQLLLYRRPGAGAQSARYAGIAWFGAGLLLGLVFLLKQNFVLLGLLSVYVFYLEWRDAGALRGGTVRRAVVHAVGAALPVLGMLLYFYAYGALGDLIYGTLYLPGLYARYNQLPPTYFEFYKFTMLWSAGWLILFAIGVWRLFVRGAGESAQRRAVFLTFGWMILLFVLVAVQRKFWIYHMMVLMPCAAVLAALGTLWLSAQLQRRMSVPAARGCLGLCLAVNVYLIASGVYNGDASYMSTSNYYTGALGNVVAYVRGNMDQSTFFKTFVGPFHSPESDRVIAAELDAHMPEEDASLLLYEFRPAVYLFTNRRTPHRYFNPTLMTVVGADEGARLISDFMEETYVRHRPEYIVFGLDGPWQEDDFLRNFDPRLFGYRPVHSFYIRYTYSITGERDARVPMGLFRDALPEP